MITDLETLIEELRDYFQSNLNTTISNINTEKGDSLLNTITANDSNYVLGGSMRDRNINNTEYVNFMYEGDVAIDSHQSMYALEANIVVEIVFHDQFTSNDYVKSLRYGKAVLDTLKNFEGSRMEVASSNMTLLTPVAVSPQGEALMASGVTYNVKIAN